MGRFGNWASPYLEAHIFVLSPPTPTPECFTPTQVELLLTMEEFCGVEGVFEQPQQPAVQQQGSGAAFAPLFANLLQLLYDVDLVEEAAITAWAEEKQHADEEDKVFLKKVGPGAAAAAAAACVPRAVAQWPS
jgi:hypothetical protein